MVPAEETLSPGTLLDGTYRLQRRLGVGGHGTVWLASDESGRFERVAIKILSSRLADSEDVRRRFHAEAVILRTLHHPGIVRALDFAANNGRLYIVMEYLPGRSLAEEMVERARRSSPFRIDEVVDRFAQVCEALGAAHARGVVHRDLKPQNVLVLQEGQRVVTKVLDFGIAKILARPGEDATTLGRMLGSYLYTSPEQISSHPVDARADVFALGCVLFEMLTLHRAWAVDVDGRNARVGDRSLRFEGPNAYVAILRRIVNGARPVPTDYRSDLPSEVDALVARALQVDRADRYESVVALSQALSDVTTSRAPIVQGGPTLPEPSLPRLPVPVRLAMSDTGLMGDEKTVAEPASVDEVGDTRFVPSPLNTITKVMSEAVPKTPAWVWQVGLIGVGGMLGAFAYHLTVGPAVGPSPPAFDSSPSPALVSPPAPVVAQPRAVASGSSVLPRSQEPDPLPPPLESSPPVKAGAAARGAKRRGRVVRRGKGRYAALRRQLEQLRAEASVPRLEALVDSIRAAAKGLADKQRAGLVERLAVASLNTGDLAGLEECIALLERGR